MGLLQSTKKFFFGANSALDSEEYNNNTVAYNDSYAPAINTIFDGNKFAGGFGLTQIQYPDYWTLRNRSSQLFRSNKYAKGLIRRLVTNEVNTGLMPEASPDNTILGFPEDQLDAWSDMVESRFSIWANNPALCDYEKQKTFGELQETIRFEALIEGDVLIVLHLGRNTGLPSIQIIPGSKVRTPLTNRRGNNQIEEGIEIDPLGKHAAYWVIDELGKTQRIATVGRNSGRKKAFMHYGTERRHGDVRGEPLLGCILQSLKELDRYSDASQRQAAIASNYVGSVEKTQEKMGSLPISGAAVRRDEVPVSSQKPEARKLHLQGQIPGIFIEEMQVGESLKFHGGSGIDINFGRFEESVIQGIAWSNEIPPEILRLSFSSNYSASQAAINEFKGYLNKRWKRTGDTLCTPIYIEWLLSEVLNQKMDTPQLLAAWRNPTSYDVFGALTAVDWYGNIKPSTDMLKSAKGSQILVDQGWSTNARESRALTGTKFANNIRRLKRENELKVETMRPLAEFRQQQGNSDQATNQPPPENAQAIAMALGNLDAKLEEVIDLFNDR